MWMIFGISAVIAAIFNVIWTIRKKDAKWFRFISLSLTSLSLCAESNLIEEWVLQEDWVSLMDVVPGMSKVLYILVIGSILINSISLFKKNTK